MFKNQIGLEHKNGFGMAGAIIVLAVLFILYIVWMYKDGLFSASEQALLKIGSVNQTESGVLNKETRLLTKPIPGK